MKTIISSPQPFSFKCSVCNAPLPGGIGAGMFLGQGQRRGNCCGPLVKDPEPVASENAEKPLAVIAEGP